MSKNDRAEIESINNIGRAAMREASPPAEDKFVVVSADAPADPIDDIYFRPTLQRKSVSFKKSTLTASDRKVLDILEEQERNMREKFAKGERELLDIIKKQLSGAGKLLTSMHVSPRTKLTPVLEGNKDAPHKTKNAPMTKTVPMTKVGPGKYTSAFADRRADRETSEVVVTREKPSPAVVGGHSSRTASSRIDDEPWIKASRYNVEELERIDQVKKELKRDGEGDGWVVL